MGSGSSEAKENTATVADKKALDDRLDALEETARKLGFPATPSSSSAISTSNPAVASISTKFSYYKQIKKTVKPIVTIPESLFEQYNHYKELVNLSISTQSASLSLSESTSTRPLALAPTSTTVVTVPISSAQSASLPLSGSTSTSSIASTSTTVATESISSAPSASGLDIIQHQLNQVAYQQLSLKKKHIYDSFEQCRHCTYGNDKATVTLAKLEENELSYQKATEMLKTAVSNMEALNKELQTEDKSIQDTVTELQKSLEAITEQKHIYDTRESNGENLNEAHQKEQNQKNYTQARLDELAQAQAQLSAALTELVSSSKETSANQDDIKKKRKTIIENLEALNQQAKKTLNEVKTYQPELADFFLPVDARGYCDGYLPVFVPSGEIYSEKHLKAAESKYELSVKPLEGRTYIGMNTAQHYLAESLVKRTVHLVAKIRSEYKYPPDDLNSPSLVGKGVIEAHISIEANGKVTGHTDLKQLPINTYSERVNDSNRKTRHQILAAEANRFYETHCENVLNKGFPPSFQLTGADWEPEDAQFVIAMLLHKFKNDPKMRDAGMTPNHILSAGYGPQKTSTFRGYLGHRIFKQSKNLDWNDSAVETFINKHYTHHTGASDLVTQEAIDIHRKTQESLEKAIRATSEEGAAKIYRDTTLEIERTDLGELTVKPLHKP